MNIRRREVLAGALASALAPKVLAQESIETSGAATAEKFFSERTRFIELFKCPPGTKVSDSMKATDTNTYANIEAELGILATLITRNLLGERRMDSRFPSRPFQLSFPEQRVLGTLVDEKIVRDDIVSNYEWQNHEDELIRHGTRRFVAFFPSFLRSAERLNNMFHQINQKWSEKFSDLLKQYTDLVCGEGIFEKIPKTGCES